MSPMTHPTVLRNRLWTEQRRGTPMWTTNPDRQAGSELSLGWKPARKLMPIFWPSKEAGPARNRFLKAKAEGKGLARFGYVSGQFPAGPGAILPVRSMASSAERTMSFHDNTDVGAIPGHIASTARADAPMCSVQQRCSYFAIPAGWIFSGLVRRRSARRSVGFGNNIAQYWHDLRSGRADQVMRRRGDQLSLSRRAQNHDTNAEHHRHNNHQGRNTHSHQEAEMGLSSKRSPVRRQDSPLGRNGRSMPAARGIHRRWSHTHPGVWRWNHASPPLPGRNDRHDLIGSAPRNPCMTGQATRCVWRSHPMPHGRVVTSMTAGVRLRFSPYRSLRDPHARWRGRPFEWNHRLGSQGGGNAGGRKTAL